METDFPSTSTETTFFIYFTLGFESSSFKRKTMKSFVSGFFQSFWSLVKGERSFNISTFHDFYNFFTIKHSKARPDFKTKFTHHFNPLECFMLFQNNNAYLHCVNIV